MKNFFKKNSFVIGIVIAVLACAGAFWYVNSSAAPTFASVTVGKGNVVQSVDEPANVMTEHSATLSFQEAGQIASVDVSEGSVVSQGQVLATLDAAQLSAVAAEADAAVQAAQAKLASLASGTRPEQLQIDESAVASARTALGLAVVDAYHAADDAVLNQTDNLFSNPKTTNPVFMVQTGDTQTLNDLSAARVQIGGDLVSWNAALASSSDPSTLSGTADRVLQEITSYLNTITLSLNGAAATASTPASTLAAYKAYAAAAVAEVQTETSAVSGAESALTAAQNQLALAEAGSTPQDIAAQQAEVAQAQAAADAAHVAVANATLVAPFSGTVQDLTAQVGEVAAPGTPMLTLVNQSGLKVQAYVPQTDIAGVKIGDAAQVTLAAFGAGTSFPAKVTAVDPGETQVNGAPAYLVTLHFTAAADGVKDGMTGNVRIIEAEHDGVVEVPTDLIITNGSSTFVLVPGQGGTVQQPVTVGIAGDDGMTEIVSGLNAGDRIVRF